MYHFKKETAFIKIDNATQNFSYPTTLSSLKEENKVLLKDVFDFPQSTSFQKFCDLRKQVIKMPLYVLQEKPNLVKRYLQAAQKFSQYLRKVQEREGITDNALVNKLFLLDTIIDEENNKVIFTNYSIIALLLNNVAKDKNSKFYDGATKFFAKNKDTSFVFVKDNKKYQLTNIYSDKYILGIGVECE